MESIGITELKTNLSQYLRQVRQGKEVTIRDRHRVIARLVPVAPAPDYDEELLQLAAQGRVTLPEQPVDDAFVEEMLARELPRVKAKGAAARKLLQQIMDEERDGR